MKTLNQMNETEFLRRCWLIADSVSDLLEKSKVAELRKVMPVLTGKETEAELEQKKSAQAKKNVKAMCKALLFDNAESTAKLLPLLYEPDVDENGTPETMTPFKTLRVITATVEDKDVLDFLSSLVKLAQTDIGA
nr:MAG TPA: hypothetical protein [Caudoviricetes sp.]DAG25398.1 MAG TPA: hypothetical protein [Bacteriophage sp.]DAH23092.1 MAG TPA: hypothetical protein [Caudoviricetes sp.]